jgi:hypothetical protein
VPVAGRDAILKIAHDIPLAGHPGIERTKARVLQNFYWPGVFNMFHRFSVIHVFHLDLNQ